MENTENKTRIEQLDAAMATFGRGLKDSLLAKLASMGYSDRVALAKIQSKVKYSKTKTGKVFAEEEPYLYNSVRFFLKKKRQDIEGIGLSFARHGIFLERGVGKNRPVDSVAADKAARPWIQPVVDPALEELADLLELEYSDIAAGELKISVPGILTTSIYIRP